MFRRPGPAADSKEFFDLAAGSAAVSPRVPAFAVGFVLVMSILGTVLMGASGRIERRVGLADAGN